MEWTDDPNSKLKMIKVAPKMLMTLIKIRKENRN